MARKPQRRIIRSGRCVRDLLLEVVQVLQLLRRRTFLLVDGPQVLQGRAALRKRSKGGTAAGQHSRLAKVSSTAKASTVTLDFAIGWMTRPAWGSAMP